jgi:2-C-methyl-D-erythritol 4-phosphate cytidylyltransferase
MAASEPRLRTVAVILAGGVGTRVGGSVPKQLLRVAGRPIIEHTLEAFERSDAVDEILVLMAPGYLADVEALVAARGIAKVSAVLEGGVTRNDSTKVALDHLGDDECNVLFHDAVRPLVTPQIITHCVDALVQYEAVNVAIPSSDTIVVVEDGVITDVPDRATLRRVQTPQGFRLSTIRKAYELAWQDGQFMFTDDCTVVLTYLPDVAVHVVDGSEHNIKVTTPVDLAVAGELLRLADDTGSDSTEDAT